MDSSWYFPHFSFIFSLLFFPLLDSTCSQVFFLLLLLLLLSPAESAMCSLTPPCVHVASSEMW